MYERYQPGPVFGSATVDNPLVGPESYGLGEVQFIGPHTYGLGQARPSYAPRRRARTMVVMQPVQFKGFGQAGDSSPGAGTGMLVLATAINLLLLVGTAYAGSRLALRAGCPTRR